MLSRLLCEGKLWFSMFHSRIEDQETGLMLSSVSMVTSTQTDNPDRGVCMVSQFSKDIFMTDEQKKSFSATQTQEQDDVLRKTDKFVNLTLLYLYRKATDEVKEFYSAAVVQKIGIEVDGVLLSSGRIIDEMDFLETAELEVDLGSLGIRTRLPIIDRHSPLAYSIAQYVHWDLAVHRGAETCSRVTCLWSR